MATYAMDCLSELISFASGLDYRQIQEFYQMTLSEKREILASYCRSLRPMDQNSLDHWNLLLPKKSHYVYHPAVPSEGYQDMTSGLPSEAYYGFDHLNPPNIITDGCEKLRSLHFFESFSVWSRAGTSGGEQVLFGYTCGGEWPLAAWNENGKLTTPAQLGKLYRNTGYDRSDTYHKERNAWFAYLGWFSPLLTLACFVLLWFNVPSLPLYSDEPTIFGLSYFFVYYLSDLTGLVFCMSFVLLGEISDVLGKRAWHRKMLENPPPDPMPVVYARNMK